MKFRKIISSALCVAHLSMIFISCGENNISTPSKGESDNIVQVSVSNKINEREPMDPESVLLSHPGLLHNEILSYFNKDDILISGYRLTKEEVIARMVDACNQTFVKYRIEQTVTEEEIAFAVQCLETWRDRGVFDVFALANERNTERVYDFLDYLAYEADEFEFDEIEDIKMAFKELEAIGIPNCNSTIIRDITSRYKSANRASATYRALDVLEHSFDFWTGITLDEEGIEYELLESTIYVRDAKLMSDIGLLLADAIGALLCWNGGPLTVICAVLASIAYIFITSKK
jgi:hypothetical protein